MFTEYFRAGGPVMYVVFGAWVVVLAAVFDRVAYATGRAWRRPGLQIAACATVRQLEEARQRVSLERRRSERGLERIDAVSQIATSIGLFGTVLGIARSFFARGTDLGLAAPEVLASGLATALFTTIAGLMVFLFGQGFLIAYREWQAFCERGVEELLGGVEA